MRTRHGLTLVELLLSLVIVGFATGAITNAYLAGVTAERKADASLKIRRTGDAFEDRLRKLLTGAELGSANAAFLSPIPGTATKNRTRGSNMQGSLVFVTWSVAPPIAYQQANRIDETTLRQRFGPQGGPTEVALSLTPVGDAGNEQGLFVREQRPPDGDPTQGGEEQVLEPSVREISFAFFDGDDWLPEWDSKEGQKDKLPRAVRVTYFLGSETVPRQFIVRLPLAGGGQ